MSSCATLRWPGMDARGLSTIGYRVADILAFNALCGAAVQLCKTVGDEVGTLTCDGRELLHHCIAYQVFDIEPKAIRLNTTIMEFFRQRVR